MVIAGNATLDAYITGNYKIFENNPNKIRITSGRYSKVFEVLDGPIRSGYKHRLDIENVEQVLRGLNF